jgi:hypothetical protein
MINGHVEGVQALRKSVAENASTHSYALRCLDCMPCGQNASRTPREMSAITRSARLALEEGEADRGEER